MLAVAPDGLVGVGPQAELEVAFDAPRAEKERLLQLLAEDPTIEALSRLPGIDAGKARALLEGLERAGAVTSCRIDPAPSRGVPLIAAILELDQRGRLPDLIWTADEALLVPPDLDSPVARQLLRAFIAGIEPTLRNTAYCYAATWMTPSVRGDVPDRVRLETALRDRELQSGGIHVLDLERDTTLSLRVTHLDSLDASAPHRLGPITRTVKIEVEAAPPDFHLAVARIATPNLARPESRDIGLWGKGIGTSPEAAEMIARAEGVERYATGDITDRTLVRASQPELPGAVAGDRLFRLNTRQYEQSDRFEPYDSAATYWWTPATTQAGARRWVLADAVFNPFHDPDRSRRPAIATSSGVAAHTVFAEARRSALCELIERDAFVWTWIQRISRERIRHATLPAPIRERTRLLEAGKRKVEFVNLTLESFPVILCVVHARRLLVLGAACHPDPVAALTKSLEEASGLVLSAGQLEPIEPQLVETPHDHLRLYRDPIAVADASFLHSADEEIGLGELGSTDHGVNSLLSDVGQPLTIDLSSPVTEPFRVARSVVPDLAPISFGWDQEPLGMPILARPRTTVDGRRLGSSLDLDRAGPLLPHPVA
jgi:ribosomal protein S12 methylthiotransferase accessory factor